MELFRIFRDIDLQLDQPLKVYCDNTQALGIITSTLQRLKTAMKHIDVANLWIRQEYQRGAVDAAYLPTSRMPADGFTKRLPKQKHRIFIQQLGMVDIRPAIETMAD
jgi:hypothetical protein